MLRPTQEAPKMTKQARRNLKSQPTILPISNPIGGHWVQGWDPTAPSLTSPNIRHEKIAKQRHPSRFQPPTFALTRLPASLTRPQSKIPHAIDTGKGRPSQSDPRIWYADSCHKSITMRDRWRASRQPIRLRGLSLALLPSLSSQSSLLSKREAWSDNISVYPPSRWIFAMFALNSARSSAFAVGCEIRCCLDDVWLERSRPGNFDFYNLLIWSCSRINLYLMLKHLLIIVLKYERQIRMAINHDCIVWKRDFLGKVHGFVV